MTDYMSHHDGDSVTPVRTPRRRPWRSAGRVALALAALATLAGMTPALANRSSGQPAIGATTVFASVPAPGHPFGIAVDKDRVYVSTSDGDFYASHLNSVGERVFAYDLHGNLVQTIPIATKPNASMGLFGLALDNSASATHRLYVADMNGRILRIALNQTPAQPQLFSQVPPVFKSGGWGTAMWNDLAFDHAGNLFVTDDKPRIWRVTPGGQPSIWFQDPRLIGFNGFGGGPLGGRIDPTGKFLYFTVTGAAAFRGDGVLYRLPLVANPTAKDLQVVHLFPVVAGVPPIIMGLAFGRSGKIYVALYGTNQIAVLGSDGHEERRISSPLFHNPWGLAFLGKSLLVANADVVPQEIPDHWKVLSVYVDERGLPLNK
jgi:DNA-binding beta-propeller fold protein YncE